MRKGFFLSFLLLSCFQVSILALEDLHKLDVQEDLKVSKHFIATKETEGPNDRVNMKNDAEDLIKNYHAVFPEKSQRAKGSYGGANLVHRRPGEKGAAPALQSSSLLIPTSIMCISLLFLPVFPVLIG